MLQLMLCLFRFVHAKARQQEIALIQRFIREWQLQHAESQKSEL